MVPSFNFSYRSHLVQSCLIFTWQSRAGRIRQVLSTSLAALIDFYLSWAVVVFLREAHESSSTSQQDLYPMVAYVILAWNTVLKCPSGDCVRRTWPQRWSSDSSEELPLCALSESLPVASWIGPCMRVLFHLLPHFRKQGHWQGWEKSVRIPEDPPIFQVCLSLAEKWLKILSGACQSIVSASFF